MNRFLILALTAGLLSPIATKSEIKKSGDFKACINGARIAWEYKDPSSAITPDIESLFKETCVCAERIAKDQKINEEAIAKCISKIWFKEEVDLKLETNNAEDKKLLRDVINAGTDYLMKKDRRYSKTDANKLVSCIVNSQADDRLTNEQVAKKCDHLFYPDTPSLFD